jgi:hypothetical protein
MTGKTFKNNKSGNLYSVMSTAIDVTANRMVEVVVYYAPSEPGRLFVRSLTEFNQKFVEYDPETSMPGD